MSLTRQQRRAQEREVTTILEQAAKGTYVAPTVIRGSKVQKRVQANIDLAKKAAKRLGKTI